MKLRQALRELRRAGWERIRKGATAHSIWQRGTVRIGHVGGREMSRFVI